VAGGERNQVSEALQSDAVAVVDEFGDRLRQ
jgi:hypothetical protein